MKYVIHDNQNATTTVLVNAIRTFLNQIPDKEINEPLPFSSVYIGWTKTKGNRHNQHFEHRGAGS